MVKTYLDKSRLHGIGVFANQFIPKGTKVWEFTEGFDLIVSEDSFLKLTNIQKNAIMFYGYKEKKNKKIIFCIDNAHHFNFSENPNTASKNDSGNDDISSYALYDIHIGDELTYSIEEDLDSVNKLPEEIYRKYLKKSE
jgi:hypothetical protein